MRKIILPLTLITLFSCSDDNQKSSTVERQLLQPTEENFSSAMADIYWQEVIDRGGDNKFTHLRQVSSVETQNIIRENRDTLYSWGIFDVTKGLVLTLPPSNGLYLSALVIDNDSYIVREKDFETTGDIGTYLAYPDKPRKVEITHDAAVTDFVYIILRTETDATVEGDKEANKLQDSVLVEQGSHNSWTSRNWDLPAVRKMQDTFKPYLAEIVAQGTSKGYNERGKTEQFHHNFYSAIGWGGQLERYATYGTTPDITTFGDRCAVVTINRPNVDYDNAGFWSYQVYGLDGYIHSNNSTLNNKNTTPNPDGTITLRFGSEAACGTNENRADKNDEGFSITTRFYNPVGEISKNQLNPSLQELNKSNQTDAQ